MKSGSWWTPAIVIAGLALLISACGEGGKESAHRGLTADEAAARSLGTDADGVGYVGTDLCLGCHLDTVTACLVCHPKYKLDPLGAAAYLESRHVNHSPLIDASAETGSCRAACHDPVGDGALLEGRPDVEGPIPTRGLAAVGCEACHGGGARHFGSGPMPVGKPDFQVCGRCHNEELSPLHALSHPEGTRILAAFRDSAHAKSVNKNVVVSPGASAVTGRCSRCHSDEGVKLYGEAVGGHDELEALLPDTLPPVESASPVQCRTCHDAHNPEALLVAATVDASAEFNTCTHCHQAPAGFGTADAYHGENSKFSWVDDKGIPTQVVGVGRFSPGRILYDTHFDDPATDGIEGYNLKLKDKRTCRNCHDVHAADPAINRQWARSRHAGRLGVIKDAAAAQNSGLGADAAIRSAALTKEVAPAWAYYPWKDGFVVSWGVRTDLTPCQRCHTATGFANFATDPEHYNPARNDYSYLTGLQKEVLYCTGCHQDNAGGLRQPGPIPFAYPSAPAGSYPDVAGSNLCLACHMGRTNGETVAAQIGLGNFSASSVLPHYLAAGGMMFGGTGEVRGIGYEFAGRNYVLPATQKHFLIGREGELDVATGTQGPCVACHFSSKEPHTLEAVSHDPTTGAVSKIESILCATCHMVVPGLGDFTLTPQKVETNRGGYRAALAALKELLLAGGYGVQDAYPYFTRSNWGADDEAGHNNLGAAFNYALLSHEPGAYVHNRFYAKRLLFDTIDWVANGALDQDALSAIQALPATPTFVGNFLEDYDRAAAIEYLSDLGRN